MKLYPAKPLYLAVSAVKFDGRQKKRLNSALEQRIYYYTGAVMQL
ncbi:MAG: hypothetical protein AAFQ91_14470 [Cyanobacteria bacterium J06621_15]